VLRWGRTYRITVAHDIAQIDPITKVPMGAKVCYGFKGLPFNFQEDTFDDIRKYLDGGMGPLLSVLCSFVWFSHVRAAAHSPRAVRPVTPVRFAGCARARLELDAHMGRRPSARSDHELQQGRQADFGQHGAPRLLPRGAGDPNRDLLCTVLRWLEIHRLHDFAQGPDPQLHRTDRASLSHTRSLLRGALVRRPRGDPRVCFQFVMEIDELLFEAYSPKKLKGALGHAAKIELPPFRSTWAAAVLAPMRTLMASNLLAPMRKLTASNLLAPMMKLGVAFVMIVLFATEVIAPQLQLARDARTVLCGTRRRRAPFGDCAIARAPPLAVQAARRAGRTAPTSSADRHGST